MGGGSKKTSTTVGYKYYLGMHLVLCHGPIDVISRAMVSKKTVWGGTAIDTSVTFDKSSIFGGEGKEGGVAGTIDFDFGEDDQVPNTYLQARLGTSIPAFRKVVSAIFRQIYVGTNPYLKPWSFRAQRIHVRQNGIAQWYPARAYVGAVYLLLNEQFATGLSSYYLIDGNLATHTIVTGTYGQTLHMENAGAPSAGTDRIGRSMSTFNLVIESWHAKFRTLDRTENDDAGVCSLVDSDGDRVLFFNPKTQPGKSWNRDPAIGTSTSGTATRFTSGELTDNTWYQLDVTYDFDTAMWNFAVSLASTQTLVYEQQLAGPNVGSANEIRFWLQSASGNGVPAEWADIVVNASNGDMNPAHIIRECLTDPDWGMGYLDADIDDTAFEAVADALGTERLGISLLWDRQTSIESFIEEIARHIDAALFIDRTTGLFTIKLIRDDFTPAALLVLDESNIEKIADLSRPVFGELTNSVTVNYWEWRTEENASVTVQDPAMVLMQNAVINTTVQYPGFTAGDIASRVAMRDLKTLSTPLWSGVLYVNRDAEDLNIGDAFKLTWADYGIDEVVMRVTGLAFGDGKSNKIRINCAQDAFATQATAQVAIPDPDDGWVPIDTTLTASPLVIATELPYYMLVKEQGQETANDILTTEADAGYAMVSAARPSTESALNAELHADDGSGYLEVDALDFAPTATLDGAITPRTLVVPLEDFDEFDIVVVGTLAIIDDEIVRVDAVSFNSVTIGRGGLDTTPVLHTNGSFIVFWQGAIGSDEVQYVATEELDVKVIPTGGGSGTPLELADVSADTITFASRPIKPYMPGDIDIGGDSFPEAIDGLTNVTVNWVHRDRLQQTSGIFYDFLDAGIGPEAATTYTLRFYDEDDILTKTVTGETGITYEWTDEGGAGPTPVTPTHHYNYETLSSNLVVDQVGTMDFTEAGGVTVGSGNGVDGNNAYIFDGLMSTGMIATLVTFTMTTYLGISCWLDADHDSTNGRIFSIRTTGSSVPSIILRISSGELIWSARSSTASASVSVTTTTQPVATSVPGFVHVFAEAIRSGATVTVNLWVNGVKLKTATDSGGQTGDFVNTEIRHGTSWTDTQPYKGLIDQSRIYIDTTALTSTEIGNLANEFAAAGLNSSVKVELEAVRGGYTSWQTYSQTIGRDGYGHHYGKWYGSYVHV